MKTINLDDKLSLFTDHWKPHILAEFNGQHLKVAKVQGKIIWHEHENEDELFLVVHGEVEILLEDRIVRLREGEIFIVPKGVRHAVRADKEAQIVLVEPASTRHTGKEESAQTVNDQPWI